MPSAAFGIGEIYAAKGLDAGAVSWYEQRSASIGIEAKFHLKLGMIRYRLGEYDAAIAAFLHRAAHPAGAPLLQRQSRHRTARHGRRVGRAGVERSGRPPARRAIRAPRLRQGDPADHRPGGPTMKVVAIALNTAREAIRNRILYSILFFAVFVVFIAAIFGAASIGDQMKFVKDFSLMSISLFGVIIAVVLGVNMLNQELGKKTIFNILSKPVARWQFIVGKFLGLLATLTLIVAIMCTTLVIFLAAFEGRFDGSLVVASAIALLEITIVIAVALFFSSLVVTPTLAGLFTAATFVAGRSAGHLQYFLTDESPVVRDRLRKRLSWMLPRLDLFTIADRVVYGDNVALELLPLHPGLRRRLRGNPRPAQHRPLRAPRVHMKRPVGG